MREHSNPSGAAKKQNALCVRCVVAGSFILLAAAAGLSVLGYWLSTVL